MSSTADLITVLKSELKAARITYAQLATELGMAESSVKRMLSRCEMPLSRIDEILKVLRLDFADVAIKVKQLRPEPVSLTWEQEQAVVSDRRLLLVAICCLSQWPAESMLATYQLTPAELVTQLTRLDRLGIIELRVNNRYRLKVSKELRWLADGPIMRFFRAEVMDDYFAGGFDRDHELLALVHGTIDPAQAGALRERLQRVIHDFSLQHQADLGMPDEQKQGYTILIGMRSWWFKAFQEMRR